MHARQSAQLRCGVMGAVHRPCPADCTHSDSVARRACRDTAATQHRPPKHGKAEGQTASHRTVAVLRARPLSPDARQAPQQKESLHGSQSVTRRPRPAPEVEVIVVAPVRVAVVGLERVEDVQERQVVPVHVRKPLLRLIRLQRSTAPAGARASTARITHYVAEQQRVTAKRCARPARHNH